MLGGVAVADGDGVVGHGVEIDDDAFRSADFVLFSVTFADIAGVIPSNEGVFGAEFFVNFASFFDKFGFVFEEWRNAELIGGKILGEFQDDARFVFAVDFLLGISA